MFVRGISNILFNADYIQKVEVVEIVEIKKWAVMARLDTTEVENFVKLSIHTNKRDAEMKLQRFVQAVNSKANFFDFTE